MTVAAIDAHQHFWRYDPRDHAWIGDDAALLRRDFLPEDLASELAAGGFVGSIVVQAANHEGETDWLLSLAEHDARLLAVVGWADLSSAALPSRLEALRAHAKLRGIRHTVQSEAPGYLLRPDVRRGIAAVGAAGLTYDLLVYERQLGDAAAIARALPHQRYVLDHLGKPDVRGGDFAAWTRALRELASCPNVSCKLSGLVTEASWLRWREQRLERYVDVALEAFGPRRLMVGSDWPVCLLAASHREATAFVRGAIARLSASEQRWILRDAACEAYGLARRTA